jgi:hypothetical protein
MAREPFAAHLTSIWIGALFFWLMKGLKGKFSEQLKKEFENRNMWTGYLISVIAFAAIVYYFVSS